MGLSTMTTPELPGPFFPTLHRGCCEHEPETDVYCDEDKIDPVARRQQAPSSPQLEIDLLTCKNYISHMLAVRRSLPS